MGNFKMVVIAEGFLDGRLLKVGTVLEASQAQRKKLLDNYIAEDAKGG